MESKTAKQHIMDHAEKNGNTCQYYVHEGDAFEAITIAEKEMKQRAIEAFNTVTNGCFIIAGVDYSNIRLTNFINKLNHHESNS